MDIPTRIVVRRLIISPTGTYNTQYMRPYDNTLQGPGLNAICETLCGENRYTPARLAGIANQIVSPAATPEKAIGIVNGWDATRCRYFMEVESHSMGGAVSVVKVLGWTNYMGIVNTGSCHIDPNMEFYVNSVVQVREYIETTPLGNQPHTNVAENAHVLVDPTYFDAYVKEKTMSMRPEDMYATMSLNHLHNMGDTLDTRTTLTRVPVASTRSNSIAAFYAAAVLDNYKKAADSNNFGLQPETEVLDSARGYAQDSVLALNPFFRAMQEYREGMLTNFFTWSDLCRLDPDVVHKVKALELPASTRVHRVGSGMSQDWGGSDRLTQVATILAQSVLALMSVYTLTRFAFTATNRQVFSSNAPSGVDGHSSITFIPGDAESFSRRDLSPFIEQFRINLEHMILKDVSHNNQIDFWLEMRINLLGETWIDISLDGGPVITYVSPSFADALMVPVVTTQTHLGQRLAGDFHEICTTIANYDGMTSTQPAAMPQKPRYGLI
ncbi:hypothetical protein HDG34_003293 [Paraburkholderia sp. HC6.4b]|uniref:hypothetical protein n=1 Tax=unclassified Paraburkholderia TaxID=2615204 RepID=UPI00160DC62E|nr:MULTISPECIES: hypothetical protein [unclassified Paraburkholderia]MBB5409352.1 hypothetical protein [Paraburkholderia sp. HC6.4b]MBB5451080.1 hypothetical protein [Paraburkholderia sp. Kb1A]